LKYLNGKWSAEVEFLDGGWCDEESTEGKLYSRYFGDIETVIDNVKKDAEKLGIVWRYKNIYMDGDGKNKNAPNNWREILKKQAERIGFNFPYTKE
jgi:hypothetical protein